MVLVIVVSLPVGCTVLAWSRTGNLRDQVVLGALGGMWECPASLF
jgi:hypothetical protein